MSPSGQGGWSVSCGGPWQSSVDLPYMKTGFGPGWMDSIQLVNTVMMSMSSSADI